MPEKRGDVGIKHLIIMPKMPEAQCSEWLGERGLTKADWRFTNVIFVENGIMVKGKDGVIKIMFEVVMFRIVMFEIVMFNGLVVLKRSTPTAQV